MAMAMGSLDDVRSLARPVDERCSRLERISETEPSANVTCGQMNCTVGLFLVHVLVVDRVITPVNVTSIARDRVSLRFLLLDTDSQYARLAGRGRR